MGSGLAVGAGEAEGAGSGEGESDGVGAGSGVGVLAQARGIEDTEKIRATTRLKAFLAFPLIAFRI